MPSPDTFPLFRNGNKSACEKERRAEEKWNEGAAVSVSVTTVRFELVARVPRIHDRVVDLATTFAIASSRFYLNYRFYRHATPARAADARAPLTSRLSRLSGSFDRRRWGRLVVVRSDGAYNAACGRTKLKFCPNYLANIRTHLSPSPHYNRRTRSLLSFYR